MPDLQGLYIVNTTRESITPQGFQTILDGTLLMPPAKSVRADLEAFRAKRRPAESAQPEVEQASVTDVSGESGESVTEVLESISDGEGN